MAIPKFQNTGAYQRADRRAIEMEDTLFPREAMEILKEEYGWRIEHIKGNTLHNMIYHLCLRNGDEQDSSVIWEAINEFMEEE